MPDETQIIPIPELPEGEHPFKEFSPTQRALIMGTMTMLAYSPQGAGVTSEQIRKAMQIYNSAKSGLPNRNFVEDERRQLYENSEIDAFDILQTQLLVEGEIRKIFGLSEPPKEDRDQYPG